MGMGEGWWIGGLPSFFFPRFFVVAFWRGVDVRGLSFIYLRCFSFLFAVFHGLFFGGGWEGMGFSTIGFDLG